MVDEYEAGAGGTVQVDWNWLTSVGAFGFGLAQVYFLVFVLIPVLRKRGEAATARPWDGALGLEWEVPSPAPFHTFETPPARELVTSHRVLLAD